MLLTPLSWIGEPRPGRGRGTFHEVWSLTWRPELDVALIEASAWGTTVPAAATAHVRALAGEDGSLAELTVLAERCLLADLPDALGVLTTAIAGRALVVLSLYWKNGKLKSEIGVAQGKVAHDKRADLKKRATDRETEREVSRFNRKHG